VITPGTYAVGCSRDSAHNSTHTVRPGWNQAPICGACGAPATYTPEPELRRLSDEPTGECPCGCGEVAYPYAIDDTEGYIDAAPGCAARLAEDNRRHNASDEGTREKAAAQRGEEGKP
jgi:hypothetical protein